MKKFITLFLLLFFIQTTLFAQSDYKKKWAEVHQYELVERPKSALEVVDEIYRQAKQEDNSVQVIKALIYQSKFALLLEENAQLTIVQNFKQEISKSNPPQSNLLESILADIYWQYFQQNRWQFYNRTRTEEKVDADDFRTWDLQTLFAEVHLHFQNSLENEEILQQIGIGEIDPLLEKTSEQSETYRPTLYDFILQNALDFYKTDETHLSKPAFAFDLNDEKYFGDLSEITIETADSLSLQYHALKLYQQALDFHRQDNDPSAYVHLQIERLRFVKNNSNLPNAIDLQKRALSQLRTQFQDHPSSTLIAFEIASMLYQQSNEYSNAKKGLKREALAICKEAIARFPESLGAQQCQELKTEITRPQLNLTAETYIPINTPSRILINYRNIDSLAFVAYRLSLEQKDELEELRGDSLRIAYINSLQTAAQWQSKLPDLEDYDEHSTEVVLPKLDQGTYLLLAKRSGEISSDSLFAYAITQVTDLALLSSSLTESHRFQVINRSTGEPIAGAKVHLTNRKRNYGNRINQQFTTDKNGFFYFTKKDSYSNVKAEVNHQDDQAIFDNFWIDNYRRGRDEQETYITARAFLFTDRSIYRPGQTVYFKGILTKSEGGKTSILPGEYVEVYLDNVNGEEVGYLRLKANEYGSFSGEFKLPTSGLNGEYSLYAEEDYEEDSKFYDDILDEFAWSETTISVEEYKRPKFEVVFDPVKETYRVNDTITVSGTASAYSGANISNAKVIYRIHRKVQYPMWYHWSRPGGGYYSEPQEIAHGELTTDADGKFTIDFKAIPDEDVSKENQPVFEYEVTADVIDINGETRSTTTIIKVGYHTMQATLNLPNQLIRNKNYQISLTTENLNGQFEPATGTVRIYKLKTPDQPQKPRIWSAPDLPLLSEEEFNILFPHEPYQDESDFEQKGELVWETAFDTEASTKLELEAEKSWQLGGYLVELTSEDRFGQEVTDKLQFQLFDPKSDAVADNQLFFWKADKSQYQSGEQVKLTIGSASDDISVIIDVEKDHEVVATHVVHLSDESKELKIPVTEKDVDGFAIRYSFAVYNSYNSGTMIIPMESENDHLTIETVTFRDRLQPDAEETWSFEIKGASKKAETELLASMYDASLDQFKPHAWTFNPIEKNQYYSYSNTSGHQSFGTKGFTVRNLPYRYYSPTRMHFDRLNWFGFSLSRSQYANQQYLRRLAASYTSKIESQNDPSGKEGYIYGTVTDPESGEALPGVNVQIKGSKIGTVTDLNGHYSIRANNGDELVFSFIGYEPATATVRKDNVINVELALDAQELSEVVVIGYGVQKKRELTGSVSRVELADEEDLEEEVSLDLALAGNAAGVSIRGNSSLAKQSDVSLIVIDGKIVDALNVSSEEIASLEVLKGEQATALYGARAAGGALIITTKTGQKKLDQELAAVKARINLKETVFFYPHLTTDKNGKINFTFTTPEALTRWKLQLLAHTTGLASQTKTLQSVTQKDLMVVPNAPRFLRQGDEFIFSAKISNLSSDSLSGAVALQLFDPITGNSIDSLLNNQKRNQYFTVSAKSNTSVSWQLKVPEHVEAVQYKVVAKAGDFSDGEQSVLTVLSNRMLVAETLPMNIRSGETKTFVLEKLKNVSSPTLEHHQLTLEVTSNPAWYAVQALPYLIEFPYECSEQTFARYYANLIGNHIVTSSPKIKAVFEKWESADQLISNLEKNEELKSIIIQETPWLRDAQSETEQKQRMAALFDLSKLNDGLEAAINKLEQMQFSSGGFPWFAGSSQPNRYISQHIATGFGQLKHLNISNADGAEKLVKQTIGYLDNELLDDYEKLQDLAADSDDPDFLKKQHISPIHIHYLYMRSFFPEIKLSDKVKKAKQYYEVQAAEYWTAFSLYNKGMIALSSHRSGDDSLANTVLTSLKETSIQNDELGMYWKANRPSWWWHESPIETQALMIEAFSEIMNDGEEKTKTVDELKIWLLKNKQTTQWSTTKATTEAVYALLLEGTDWLAIDDQIVVEVGSKELTPPETPEAGTGYFKTTWKEDEIKPEMAEVTLTKEEEGIAWGALYWQYFEDLDKISSAETPLKLSKQLFVVKNSDRGEVLSAVKDTTTLSLGSLVRVRIELKSDRDMEFVHMKDMRASGMEPVNVLSEYKWQDGLGYYESTKDASTNFFFDFLPKGVYVFEYDLRVNNEGNFSNGITTIQCMYAPEFSSHSEGVRVEVK